MSEMLDREIGLFRLKNGDDGEDFFTGEFGIDVLIKGDIRSGPNRNFDRGVFGDCKTLSAKLIFLFEF